MYLGRYIHVVLDWNDFLVSCSLLLISELCGSLRSNFHGLNILVPFLVNDLLLAHDISRPICTCT